MKWQLFSLLSLSLVLNTTAQQINDPNFARAVREYCTNCIDGQNRITVEGQKLRSLTIAIQEINDLTGVLGFSSLESLNCGNNNLTSIPPLPPSLKSLFISNNKLTELNNLPQGLLRLYCQNNMIKTISDLPPRLELVNLSYNEIKQLPVLPSSLKSLFCSNNQLTVLPELPKYLEGLECGNNKLKNLPPILPLTLSFISCQNNSDLVCLPLLPDSLAYLYIPKNIKCLPNIVSNAITEYVEGISHQRIKLPQCTPLELAYCPPLVLKPVEEIKKIALFPNPTLGELYIIQKNIEINMISIYNFSGQLVKQINNKVTEIDITSLSAGYYIVKINTDFDVYQYNIIKL